MSVADGHSRGRRAVTSALFLVAGLTTITIAERPSVRSKPVFDGPSMRATCTAFLLDTGELARRALGAPGYALTSGRCPAACAIDEPYAAYLTPLAGVGRCFDAPTAVPATSVR